MFQIRKVYKFEGAHILSDAVTDGCKNHIHGHSYKVEVFLSSSKLDENSMIIDFSALSDLVKGAIMEWDHKLLADVNDTREQFKEMADILLPFNPTAERMAEHLYFKIGHTLGKIESFGLVAKVRVHETDTGYAEYWEG